jgi:hypothetical protein
MISEGLSYIDFVFDIVCMMPPLDSPYSAIISRDHAIYFTLAACTMLILSVVFITVKKENPEFVNLALVGTLVILILGFISASNLIKSECIVGYPAMIITLRLGELSLAGYRISKKISLSFLLAGILAFFLSVIIIYYYLVRLSPDKIAIIKYGWGVFGIIIASVTWTHMISKVDIMSHILIGISCFCIFASTGLYILACPSNSIERWLFQGALPFGFTIGIIIGLLEKRKLREA